MPCGVDEVEAAVHPVVDNMSPVETALIVQVPLKLVVNVVNHRLETEIQH